MPTNFERHKDAADAHPSRSLQSPLNFVTLPCASSESQSRLHRGKVLQCYAVTQFTQRRKQARIFKEGRQRHQAFRANRYFIACATCGRSLSTLRSTYLPARQINSVQAPATQLVFLLTLQPI